MWSRDEYNEPVVSLLKVHKSSSARELTHNKGVNKTELVDTDDVADSFSRSFAYFAVGIKTTLKRADD